MDREITHNYSTARNAFNQMTLLDSLQTYNLQTDWAPEEHVIVDSLQCRVQKISFKAETK